MELLGRLARDFNVRDPRKLYQIARREFPDRRDLAAGSQRSSGACMHPQVALDLLRAGQGAAACEGPRSRCAAHEELGEIRRGGLERPVRADGDVLLQPDAAGGEGSQQRAVFGADGRGCVLDMQVRRGALQQGCLLTVRSAVGSTPGAFSRSVTRWPSELKLPRMASPWRGASRSTFLKIRGVNGSCARLKMLLLSAPGARTK